MKDVIKVQKINKPTDKGNVVLNVSLTRGLMTETNYFLLSTPETIKAAGVKEGDDISDMITNYKIEKSVVPSQENPDEMIEFKWIKPA